MQRVSTDVFNYLRNRVVINRVIIEVEHLLDNNWIVHIRAGARIIASIRYRFDIAHFVIVGNMHKYLRRLGLGVQRTRERDRLIVTNFHR